MTSAKSDRDFVSGADQIRQPQASNRCESRETVFGQSPNTDNNIYSGRLSPVPFGAAHPSRGLQRVVEAPESFYIDFFFDFYF
jgi:hypothetical protein